MPARSHDLRPEGVRPDEPWPAALSPSIEISDRGLVVGAGSLLVRMTREGLGAPRLALDVDGERFLALLSVASREPVRTDVLRHVEAASDHWRQGDKALANLRLVFAGLPRLADPADAYRLRLAEHLLDEGLSPRTLLKELGFDTSALDLVKYAPDQPRVPAGSGRESGRWTSGAGGFIPSIGPEFGDRIVVAANEGPPEDPKTFDEREASGLTTPSENVAHGYPITPTDGTPVGYGRAAHVPPTPVGGRLGSAATRAQNAAIATKFEKQGYELMGGGGKLKEEYIKGDGPGTRGSTYVDVTVQHRITGEVVRIQTIDTRADGTPTSREVAAAARIQSKNPTDPLHLIRKK